MPLSGDEGMSRPRVCPRGAPERNGPESYRDNVPPRDVTWEVFGLNDAAVLTPAIAGRCPRPFLLGRQHRPGREYRPLPGWNSRPLLRIYPWPMMLGGGGGAALSHPC